MARTEASLKVLKFENGILPEYWAWTEEEKEALRNRDLKKIGEIMMRRLGNSGHNLTEFYLSIHDRDSSYIHIHGLGKMEKKFNLKPVAKILGIRLSQMEVLNQGGFSYDDSLAYLTHMKETYKAIYPPESVVTFLGTDYIEIYKNRKEKWLKGREIKKKLSTYDKLKPAIISGKITREDMLNNHFEEYVENKSKYDKLFQNLISALWEIDMMQKYKNNEEYTD